jgi:hypothetical protein
LNSGLHDCKPGPLPLEPYLQSHRIFLKRQKKENLRGGAQNGEKLNKASRVPGRKEEQYFQVLLHSKVTTVNNNTLYISKLLKE